MHHHIAGPYLASYAAEMDWREDNRRISNGEQFSATVAAPAMHPVSRTWKGHPSQRASLHELETPMRFGRIGRDFSVLSVGNVRVGVRISTNGNSSGTSALDQKAVIRSLVGVWAERRVYRLQHQDGEPTDFVTFAISALRQWRALVPFGGFHLSGRKLAGAHCWRYWAPPTASRISGSCAG
jgi:hypothetical protein